MKDFMPISDVKQSVEKEVQQKPTLAELTTIESPGRPSPANMLESPIEKTRARKRKKEKAISSEITQAKKDSILIITEKPQAALKIANSLGNAKKYSEEGVSYYKVEKSGNKILVASAVGHLFNLTYKKGQKGWPVFEIEWIPSYEKKSSAFTKRYFDVLKRLSGKAKEFIVATDYDNEGEVIGWNILRFICKQKNAKRMKFSTLTSEELKKAYEKPSPELNWGNAYAGETRHILDWLYGINLSRALMSAIKTSDLFKILSIGRVQGPALKIIVDRERLISSFKSVPYWQVFAEIDWKATGLIEPDKGCRFKFQKDIFNKNELEPFKNIKEAIAETKESEESILPGHPFDLTTLQREAYRLFKINPSETLKIAQQLYLDGLISYPRTSSQKIPEAIQPKKILKILEKQFPEAKRANRNKPIEGKKDDPAHPSIYPTGEFADLKEREQKLYQLIVKRFISAFCPDAQTSNKKIILTAVDKKEMPILALISPPQKELLKENEELNIKNKEKSKIKPELIKFTASGLTIKESGWLSVYPSTIEENQLPSLNGKVIIEKIDIEEKETQPQARYTSASLVSLLEKKNLGTKATRSMIVDTLFNRGYLDGKSIQATQLGLKLIETLEKHSPIIIDEHLTRQLEEEMEKIQESNSEFEKKEKEVIEKAKRLIIDISKEFKSQEISIGKDLAQALQEIRKEQQENNTLMLCPVCKKGNLRILFNRTSRRYFVACSAYPDCRQTYSLPPNALIKKTDNEKKCEVDGFPKLLAIKKAKRPWEFCFNPDCPVEKAKREEWSFKNQIKN